MLCLSITFVPAVLKTIYPERTLKKIEESEKGRLFSARIVNFLAMICQLGSIGLWVYYVYIAIGSLNSQSITLMVLVAVSPILVSLTWWENFVKQAKSKSKESSSLDDESSWLMRLKLNMRRHRVKIGLLVNLWKIIVTLIATPNLLLGIFCENGDACIKAFYFQDEDAARLRYITNATMKTEKHFGKDCIDYFPYMVSVANILSNIICFKFAKAACKILAQKLCFALPVVLSTPVVIGLILSLYSQTLGISFGKCYLPMPIWKNENEDPTILFDIIDTYWVVIAAGALGYFSFLLVTNHVWSPSKERLIATDRYDNFVKLFEKQVCMNALLTHIVSCFLFCHRLFVQPLFNGALLDQSLLLNRRRTDDEFKRTDEHNVSNYFHGNLACIHL